MCIYIYTYVSVVTSVSMSVIESERKLETLRWSTNGLGFDSKVYTNQFSINTISLLCSRRIMLAANQTVNDLIGRCDSRRNVAAATRVGSDSCRVR